MIYKTRKVIILCDALYGCITQCLVLEEDCSTVGVSDSRSAEGKRLFGPKKEQKDEENYIMRIFIICTLVWYRQ
jgi:hypothetical protein